MGVQADHHRIAVGDQPPEQFDLIGVDIRRGALDRRGQVEDNRLVRRRLEHVHHRGADFDREIELGSGKRLGRIFETPVGAGVFRCLVAQDLGPGDGDVLDLSPAHPEHDLAPCWGHRIIQVDDRGARPFQAGEACLDQVAASLGQYLHGHIVGNAARTHQIGDIIEVGRARSGKADLDFLDPDLAQQVEKPRLLFRPHRVDQRLVAIAQVGRQPARRRGYRARWPLPVGQVDGREGSVFGRRVAEHGHGVVLKELAAASRGGVAVPWASGAPQSRTPHHAQGRISRRVRPNPRFMAATYAGRGGACKGSGLAKGAGRAAAHSTLARCHEEQEHCRGRDHHCGCRPTERCQHRRDL